MDLHLNEHLIFINSSNYVNYLSFYIISNIKYFIVM